MSRLTDKQLRALALLQNDHGCIDACDPRTDQFSDDAEPDTWNQLFQDGLAKQIGPGWSGDDFTIILTDAGRAALKDATRGRDE